MWLHLWAVIRNGIVGALNLSLKFSDNLLRFSAVYITFKIPSNGVKILLATFVKSTWWRHNLPIIKFIIKFSVNLHRFMGSTIMHFCVDCLLSPKEDILKVLTLVIVHFFLMPNNMPWSGYTGLFIHSPAEGHRPFIELNVSILQLNDYSREWAGGSISKLSGSEVGPPNDPRSRQCTTQFSHITTPTVLRY